CADKLDKTQVKCPPGASGLYPHPYDCTKFLQCANGITYIQDCGPGTGFDSAMKVCDYKEKIHCVAGSSWGMSHSVESYGQHGVTEYEVAAEHVQCPPGVSGLHPHPQDCGKFLQCSNGQTFIQDCGPGTGFDSLRLVCDYKEKVQCCSGSVWGVTTDVTTIQHGREFPTNILFVLALFCSAFSLLRITLMLFILRLHCVTKNHTKNYIKIYSIEQYS
ncbi:peritrophin-1-like, partial [Musca autumnalis]|uniref:peritrophin-1-like n=1 Tax=Musca autumnalis TaxID=221902 RepID=UPI003CF11ABD